MRPVLYKLLIKKPPGMMSAGGASSMCEQCASKPLRAWEKKKGREKERNARQLNVKNKIKRGQRKETNTESGARRRIFVGVLRSMGSARVGCPMRFADGTLHQSVLGRL